MRSWQKHGLAVSACAATEVGPKDTKSFHRFRCLQFHMHFCTGYNDAAATSFLQSTMGQRMQQQWAAASKEEHLQACLNKIVPEILSRCHGESREYYDTSRKPESCLASSAMF